MVAYVIAEVHITDDSWVEDYIPKVHAQVEALGGRYLAQSLAPDHLEGDGSVPSVIALLEFPSIDVAKTWYNSADYQPYMKARMAGSTGDLWLINSV